MRKTLALLLVPATLGSCNTVGFGAVSINPIYGWEDGCNAVHIGGHGMTDDVSATIGTSPVTGVVLPTEELEVGFGFDAVAPAGTAGEFADVTVTSDGVSDVIPKGFYYVACPLTAAGTAAPYAEAAEPSEGVTAGTTVTVSGCNLTAGTYSVQIGDADPVPLTSSCGEGVASFIAPELDDGSYALSFVDGTGTVVYPIVACGGGGGDSGDTATDTAGDTASDTASDTAVPPCDAQLVLTYGGAQ